MDPVVETPVVAPSTPVVEAPPPIGEAPPSKSKDSRRAAAMASFDEPPKDEKPNDALKVDDEPKAPKVEAPKVEEPKPNLELQARAIADRYLQGERKKLEEREAAIKAREVEVEESRKAPVEDVAKVHRMVAADIVEYADQQKWSAKQRYEMAQALGWSSQPEDKRPVGWRGNGQGHVLSEVEQLRAELGKTKAEVDGWKTTQKEREEQAAAERHDASLGDEILASIPADAAYAKGFAAHAPQVARRELAKLAREMVDAEREKAAEEYRKPTVFTGADVAKEYDKRWREVAEQNYGWLLKVAAPQSTPQSAPTKVLPAKATASPSSPLRLNGKQSKEERRREALEALRED